MHLCDPRSRARVTVAEREVVFDGGAKYGCSTGCSTSCSTRIRGTRGARRRCDERSTSTTIEDEVRSDNRSESDRCEDEGMLGQMAVESVGREAWLQRCAGL